MAGVKGKSGRKRMTETPKTSKCSTCGETKDAKAFYTNNARRSKLSTVCRECNTLVTLEASYRRAIRTHGADAFRARINDLEDRLTLMRRILLGYKPKTKLNKP